MDPAIVAPAVGGFIVAVVLKLYLKNRRGRVQAQHGTFVLRYGMLWRVLMWSTALIAVLIAVALAVGTRQENLSEMLPYLAGVVVFIGVAVAGLIEVIGVRHHMSELGLKGVSPWRAQQELRWEDVVAISFNDSMWWFRVSGRDGQIVRLSTMLGGVSDFAEAVLRRQSLVSVTEPKALELMRKLSSR